MTINKKNCLFNDWIKLKKKLDRSAGRPHITEGEIWWCGVGQNVGVEINGKHKVFSRPVLVLTKLSRLCFLAVPLSTKYKEGSWYVPFNFQGKHEIAVLSQVRVISVSRLYSRMGKIDEQDFRKIRNNFQKLYP